MALQKRILESNGAVAIYHRLGNVNLNHDKKLTCVLESYADKSYALHSNNRIGVYYFIFDDISIEEEENTGIRELAYNKIKQEKIWEDAIDC